MIVKCQGILARIEFLPLDSILNSLVTYEVSEFELLDLYKRAGKSDTHNFPQPSSLPLYAVNVNRVSHENVLLAK